MLSIITWNELFFYLLVFLTIYYAAVLAVYYRQELVKLASRFKTTTDNSDDKDVDETFNGTQDSLVLLYNRVHDLMQNCKAIFNNLTNAPLNREKIIEELQLRVKKYPEVKGTAFQISLTNHFAQEADQRLGIKLSDNELEQIWI